MVNKLRNKESVQGESWLRAETLRKYVDLTEAQLKLLRLTQWVEGVHFIRINRRSILYNLEQVRRWVREHSPELPR